MGKAELTIFIILINVILLIFIIGLVVFIFQYRKRKVLHNREKAAIEKQFKLDLLNNQLLVQQQTMQFIGSEIHDSVAQKLTLASLYSQKLEFENKYPGMMDKLSKISNIINDSLTELRDLSKTLTNNIISDTGLEELLRTERGRINDAGSCRMELESDLNRSLSFMVKSSLLRVIQEFIQNSLKHSGCSVIKIAVNDKPEGLYVSAADNGKGFDSDHPNSGGIGLSNMKRRIHLVGGTLTMQGEPGNGTRLEIFIDNKSLLNE